MDIKPEILDCARKILSFFRDTHPRQEAGSERTLTERLEILSGWVEDSETKGLYGEKGRAQKLRELYERSNPEEIEQYANQTRHEVNSMTGGFIPRREGIAFLGFNNETTQNHLRYFDAKYIGNPFGDYAQENDFLHPHYQSLLDRVEEIKSTAFEIREVIIADMDFKENIKGKPEAEMRARYLVEEFKKKDQIIPLLMEVERLYSDTINLTKAVINISEEVA